MSRVQSFAIHNDFFSPTLICIALTRFNPNAFDRVVSEPCCNWTSFRPASAHSCGKWPHSCGGSMSPRHTKTSASESSGSFASRLRVMALMPVTVVGDSGNCSVAFTLFLRCRLRSARASPSGLTYVHSV